MLANLITSLFLSIGVGVCSFMDQNIDSKKEEILQNSITTINGEYVINGVYLTNGLNDISLNASGLAYARFEFLPSSSGYIFGDLNINPTQYSTLRVFGENQVIYDGVRFFFVNDGGLFDLSVYVHVSNFRYDGWYQIESNMDERLYSHQIAISDCKLSDIQFSGGLLDEETLISKCFPFIDELYVCPLGQDSGSSNPSFNSFYYNGGRYTFNSSFNPNLSLFDSFTSPDFDYVILENQQRYNHNYDYVMLDQVNYFSVDYSLSNPFKIKEINLFEGLFNYGGKSFTNIIAAYSLCSPVDLSGDNHVYGRVQFVYAYFYSSISNERYFFLSTFKTTRDGVLLTPFSFYDYNSSVESNYDITQYSDTWDSNYHFAKLNWISFASINIKYALTRPSNSFGLRSGTDYYTIIGFNSSPSDDVISSPLLDTFDLISYAFLGVSTFFGIQVLPSITIGTLLLLPIVFVIILAIVKLFKR